MQFRDSDIHDAMKVSLEALIGIINANNDPLIKGNAAINLANILFDIYDRQKHIDDLMALDIEDEDIDDYE
jgi:hypothetical protein